MNYTRMSESEILEAVLLSKEFRLHVGDAIRDSLTDEDAAILAYKVAHRPVDGETPAQRHYELYFAFLEAIGGTIQKTLDFEIERFKENEKHLSEDVREPDSYQ